MLSKTPYRTIVLILMMWMFDSKGQTIESQCPSYYQNKIEIVLNKSCDLRKINELKVIDSLFSISQFTVYQLEKNLIYKTSNRIKFIVFDKLMDFEKYQNEQPLNEIQSFNFQPIQVYFPIFIGTSRQKIEYQIRKGAASQFISEYLFGLSYREQSEGMTHSPIPQWIIKGFVSYFAGGIEVFDFQQFVINNKKGYYKNINFIPEHVQTNFGCIVWYLFEKEKGRGFNSAFWYLIKYVNSFQESFEYQFGISFKRWLKSKISEIENRNRFESSKLDYQKNFPQYDNFRLIQSLELRNHTTSKVFHNIATPNKQFLLLDDGRNVLKLYETPRLSQDFKTNFNQFEIIHNIENKTLDGSIVLLHFQEGHWLITEIQSNKLESTTIDLGQEGIFRNLKPAKNGFMVLHDVHGLTQIEYLDFKNNKTIIAASKNYHLFDYCKDTNFIFTLYSDLSANRTKHSFVVKEGNDGKLDTLFSDSNALAEIRLENFIIENQNHFSFIRSGEHQQQIVHLIQSSGSWNIQKLETKGYFFQQIETPDKQDVLTFFRSSVGIQMVQFAKDEKIFAQDTFVKQLFSFDTIRYGDRKQKNDSIVDSSNGYFLSYFKLIPGKEKNKRFAKQHTLQVPMLSSFSQAFYTSLSKLYLSNEELDIPYLTKVPLSSTFNSMATVFFRHLIESNDKKHRFNSVGFSTIDRNRYGMQFRHSYFNGRNLISSEMSHRARQYKSEYGDIFDNKVTKFATSIASEILHWGTSAQVSYEIQSDFVLNTNESATKSKNRHLQIGEIGFSIFPKKPMVIGAFKLKSQLGIKLSGGYQNDSIFNFSKLVAKANMQYSGRLFEFKSKLDAVYSIFNSNTLQFIGGSKGSLMSNQYDVSSMNQIMVRPRYLMENGGSIRGFPVGARVGSNSVVLQNEILMSPLNLFPSRVIESTFWKKLFFVGFLDIGTAFIGNTPGYSENPFNTKIYQTNTYTVSVNAERDAYLLGIGYGINMSIWGYEFRLERAFGFNENVLQNKMFHVSLGKNF